MGAIIQAKTKEKVCCNCKELFPNIEPHFHGRSRLCGPCRNRQGREVYDSAKDRARQLKYRYGITIDEYDVMYEKQKGCCALCSRFKSRLVVDHNHDTGAVRGLLCHHCNGFLGVIDQDPSILGRIENYRD